MIKPIAYKATQDRIDATWSFADGAGLNLSMVIEPDSVIFSTRCPSDTGARTVPLIVARQHGKQARFITLLHPYEKQTEKPKIISHTNDQIIIEHQNKTDTISLGQVISLTRSKL